MNLYLGDMVVDATLNFKFTTSDASGGAVAPSSAFEAADLKIYKDASATERSSAAGITMTSPFDSITGLHHVTIDLSDDTDSGFWATGSDYMVVLSPDETVDGQTIIAILAQFSIGNRTGATGVGATEWTYTLTDSDSGDPLADASVWITTDAGGTNVIASGTTNDSGVVTFYLDAGTVYVWRSKAGYNFSNPDTEVVS